MPIPPHRSAGDTGHIGDHNDMADQLTSNAATINSNTNAISSHTGGTDPHGDRAYADTTKASISHTHSFPVTSVNTKTGAVTLIASDVGAVATTLVGAASGVASLDSTTHIPSSQIPGLDGSKITTGTISITVLPTGTTSTTVSLGNHTHAYVATSSVGAANGVASLDASVLVPTSQIPSLDASKISTGTLGIARIPTGSTSTTVALGNDSRLNVYEWTPADHGMQAWAYDPVRVGSTSTVVTAGVLNVIKVKLPVAGSLTKVFLYVNTAGATLTNSFAGLYDSSGTRQALTADQSSNWTSTGLKTISFTGSYSAAIGSFYIAILVGTATTAPAFGRNTSSGATGLINANVTGASLRFATISTGLTALPASFTPASLTASDVGYWGAVG